MGKKTLTAPSTGSNEAVGPSTWDGWFDELEALPIDDQIMVVKEFARALPNNREVDKFMNDPRTRAWISRNFKAINASVKQLKSHGYNSNPPTHTKAKLPNE